MSNHRHREGMFINVTLRDLLDGVCTLIDTLLDHSQHPWELLFLVIIEVQGVHLVRILPLVLLLIQYLKHELPRLGRQVSHVILLLDWERIRGVEVDGMLWTRKVVVELMEDFVELFLCRFDLVSDILLSSVKWRLLKTVGWVLAWLWRRPDFSCYLLIYPLH
jgi:hypothetical protein